MIAGERRVRHDDYRNISWDLEDVIRLLEDASEHAIAPAGLSRGRGELEEALADQLRELEGCVSELLADARATDAADWKEREQELMRRLEHALDPLRESFAFLHKAIVDDCPTEGKDIEYATKRLKELKSALWWAQRRAAGSS